MDTAKRTNDSFEVTIWCEIESIGLHHFGIGSAVSGASHTSEFSRAGSQV
jgi:hypothetical protein